MDSTIGFLRRALRLGGRWYQWATDGRARARLHRVGWYLVPRIEGGVSEGIASFLRYRVVNRALNLIYSESFESRGATVTMWKSIGTDATGTLNYWTTDAGSPTIASNVATTPSGARIVGGHQDWANVTFNVRFKANTAAHEEVIVHFTNSSNFIYADATGSALNFRKILSGSDTLVGGVAATLTNGNQYWMQVVCSGTSYTATIFNDTGPGSRGTQVATTTQTVSDTILQNGRVGLWAVSASVDWGGAFSVVCQVTDSAPVGTAQWNQVVTAGEPAFSWSFNTYSPAHSGVWSASIRLDNSLGNGSWQANPTMAGASAFLNAYIKVGAGAPNITAGGLVSPAPSADNAYHLVTSPVTTMSANPTISCNYSGAVGTAYFDTLSISTVVGEITDNLPHLNRSTWSIVAIQPGNPGSSAVGSFTIPLHPPGSRGYAAAKAIYDQLDYLQRVEGYISPDGVSLGKLKFTGIILGIEKSYGLDGASYELSGTTDLGLANYSRPFPGELLSNQVLSSQIKSFMGVNELGASDNFNPYTSSKYTSSFVPGGGNSAGTWTGTTDDGFNVVTTSTGSGAALISAAGAAANDGWHIQYAECTGRLKPVVNTSNAGTAGIGLSRSNANCNDAILGRVLARRVGTRYLLDAALFSYANGAQVGNTYTQASVLINVEDPQSSMIPLTLGLLLTTGGSSGSLATATFVVNGKVVIGQYATSFDPGFGTMYPFLYFSIPASGTANVYLTNLVQMTRFTADGPSTASAFAPGTITPSSDALPFGTDPGPNFLDVWTRIATKAGWYWRYTPQAYAITSRTLGTVDMAADPGTDLTSSVIFRRSLGNLLNLQLTANADRIATDTAISGQPTLDGGGIGFWRDVGSLGKYGVIQDEALSGTHSDFSTLRRAAYQIAQNKVTLGGAGSKTAVVLRDNDTADRWRELDRVLIDDPELGINNLSARVIGYTFTEGDPKQTVMLDQFSREWLGG